VRRAIREFADKLVLGPARDLLDTTAFLLGSPASVARQFAAERRLAAAGRYFVVAFSSAVILHKIASAALGIETINEILFWSVHVALVLCIALLAALLAVLLQLQLSPFSMFLKPALLAYGASFLIGGFVLAVASATLVALREVGYIPDFKHDLARMPNFHVIGMQAYYDCLRKESTLFNALYNGVGGAYEGLRPPIDNLSYVQPLLHVAASFLFAGLVYFGTKRKKVAAGLAALLSCMAIFGSFLFGLTAYDSYLFATTPCGQRSVQEAQLRTAEDTVREMAEHHATRNIGRPNGLLMLTGVEAQERTLILRIRVEEHATNRENFPMWVSALRRRIVQGYCISDHGALFRRIGISEVWLLRYADTELVDKIVQSADHCRH